MTDTDLPQKRERGQSTLRHLLGDAVNAAAAVGEHGADIEADRLTVGVVLGDERQHVGVGGMAAHRDDDDAVGDVVVEIRHGHPLATDLGEGQHRDLDNLDRFAEGVDRPTSAAHIDVGEQPVALGLVVAALDEQGARAGEGSDVVDVTIGVVVEGEAVGQPDDRS